MKITPLDIQQQEFRKSFLSGYDKKEVDEFLDLVKEEMERITTENNRLKEEIKRRESDLSELRARERVLKDTMMTAQKITEDIKVNAKKEGELIISQAEIQAEKIVKTAQRRLNEIIDDINELKRQRAMFESTLKSVIDKHNKLLEIASDEEVGEVNIENKISFFPK
jgi:cell division initiation protein